MASTYIENAIRARLLADSTVTAICSTRIYYQEAPIGVSKPYVVIHEIDDPDENWNIGVDGSNPRIQIDSVDDNESFSDAKALDKAIRASLKEFKGSMDGMNVHYIKKGNSKTFREPENILRITRDFLVNYDRV